MGPAEILEATDAAVATAPMSSLIALFTVFILAIFVGYYVVWNVTSALHSPLMSVTNAISSVIIVGALIAAGPMELNFSKIISSFKFKSPFELVICISILSKDKPSPSAKSAKPPKSASDKSFTKPGALITLKFSINNFEEEDFSSIIDEYVRIPSDNPLKKLYSDNKGWGRSE